MIVYICDSETIFLYAVYTVVYHFLFVHGGNPLMLYLECYISVIYKTL